MNSEETELCLWTVLVVIFFGCIAVVIGNDNPDSVIAQGCMVVAVALTPLLAIRFRWFRIMLLWVFFVWLMLVWGSNKKKDNT